FLQKEDIVGDQDFNLEEPLIIYPDVKDDDEENQVDKKEKITDDEDIVDSREEKPKNKTNANSEQKQDPTPKKRMALSATSKSIETSFGIALKTTNVYTEENKSSS